jgi:hypothetical protein
MKRSVQVAAPLLASAAVSLLTACRNPEMQRCVDAQNHVVDDSFCRNQPMQPNGATGSPNPANGSNYVYVPTYRYYYGGGGSYVLGSTVSGGSYTATSGVSYSTTRGGFGSTFHGGEGGSGGHGGGGE